MTDLTKKEAAALVDLRHYNSFSDLTAHLSSEPRQTKRNKFAGNAEYVPISQIESDLDDIYGEGLWQINNFQLLPLGASTKKDDQIYVAATIELQVLHPITRQWVTRAGAASGYVSHGTISTFAAKLKAEALKNAAKSLGNIFGRNLNREDVAQEANEAVEKWLEDEGILDMIEQAKRLEDLEDVQSKLDKKVQRHPVVRSALNKKAKTLLQK